MDYKKVSMPQPDIKKLVQQIAAINLSHDQINIILTYLALGRQIENKLNANNSNLL